MNAPMFDTLDAHAGETQDQWIARCRIAYAVRDAAGRRIRHDADAGHACDCPHCRVR